jgi:hypothetical protein
VRSLRFRVQDLEFRDSDLRLQVLGFGFRGSGCGVRVAFFCVGFRVSGLCFRIRVSSGFRVAGFGHGCRPMRSHSCLSLTLALIHSISLSHTLSISLSHTLTNTLSLSHTHTHSHTCLLRNSLSNDYGTYLTHFYGLHQSTEWGSRVSVVRISNIYVTKFSPHLVHNIITRGESTFDERVERH